MGSKLYQQRNYKGQNIYSPARHLYQTAENPRRIPRRFPKFVKFSAKNGIKENNKNNLWIYEFMAY